MSTPQQTEQVDHGPDADPVGDAIAAGRNDISTAQQEAREAAHLLDALTERVRAGDTGVRPAELRDARELVEYANLRVEAAQRRAAQLAGEARQAQLDAVAAEIRAHYTDPDAFDRALTDVETAMAALCQLGEDRRNAINGFRARLHALDVPVGQGSDRSVFMDQFGSVGAGGRVLRTVDLGTILASAISRTAQRYGLQAGGRSLANRVSDPYGNRDLHAMLRSQV